MILYLDFDGVLHPHDVFLESGTPILRPDPALGVPDWVQLFSFAPILEDAIASRPDIRIVLSTSWAAHLGLEFAKNALPDALRDRVIGATGSPRRHTGLWGCSPTGASEEWLLRTRYQQIAHHAQRHGIEDWFAIDDDTEGWPEDQRHRLVAIENPTMGLFDEDVQARLREVLNGTS